MHFCNMKSNLLLILVLLFPVPSCRSQQSVKAKIFERKQIEENRLLIKFGYVVNEKEYIDSSIIKNVVLASDSINVIIDPANPAKAIPDFKSK